MPAIFISHSSIDQKITDDIVASLVHLRFDQIFLDYDPQTGIPAGDNWEKRLYEELSRCHAVILVLTHNWMASKWCFAEFTQARALGKVILPIICEPLGERVILPDIQAIDLADWNTGGLGRLEQRLRAITDELARGFALDPRRPPYPGIHAFEAEDAAIYFGRDEETRAAIERLDARRTQGGARLLMILGASGSGKSSLLKAGVLPQLTHRQREWIVLPPIRPEKAPVEIFAKAIAQHFGKPDDWRAQYAALNGPRAIEHIEELIKDLRVGDARNATVLLPIDQFEEIFTVAAPGERVAFLRLLTSMLDPARGLPAMVLATGRSDVLDQLIAVGDLARVVETFPLPLMPLDRVARLVEGPAAVAGLNVDKGLAERIARDLESPEALPLLAHTLWLLHRRGVRDKKLSLAEYDSLGDPERGLNPIQNSLRLVADQAIGGDQPSKEQIDALRDAFVPRLVRVRLDDGKRVRQPARLAEFPPGVLPVVQALIQARLLTTRVDGADTIVEASHEALFKAWPTLDQLLTEEHGFLTDIERIRGAHQVWAQAPDAEKAGALLHGLLLAHAREWHLKFPHRFVGREIEPLRAFIAASAEAEDAERARAAEQAARTRRMERWLVRGAIAAAAVFALLAVAAGVEAWIAARNEARAARNFDLTISQADALVSKISTELKDRIGISQDVMRRTLALIEGQFDEIAKVDPTYPRLRLSRAVMLSALVDNYLDLGDIATAKRHAENCVEIMRPLVEETHQARDMLRGMGRCLEKLGDTAFAYLSFDEAVDAYEKSVALRRRVRDADPADGTAQLGLCHVLGYYAQALLNDRKGTQASAAAKESLDISTAWLNAGSDTARWRREHIESLNFFSTALFFEGQFGKAAPDQEKLKEALSGYEKSRQLARELADQDKGNAALQRFLSNLLGRISAVLTELGRGGEALAVLQEALEIKRRLVETDAENTTWQRELASALMRIGDNQVMKNPRDALVALNQARGILEGLLQHDPKNGLWRSQLIFCLWSAVMATRNVPDVPTARATAETALTMIKDFDYGGLGLSVRHEMMVMQKLFTDFLTETAPR